jgi:hypothetical protein
VRGVGTFGADVLGERRVLGLDPPGFGEHLREVGGRDDDPARGVDVDVSPGMTQTPPRVTG